MTCTLYIYTRAGEQLLNLSTCIHICVYTYTHRSLSRGQLTNQCRTYCGLFVVPPYSSDESGPVGEVGVKRDFVDHRGWLRFNDWLFIRQGQVTQTAHIRQG